MAGQLLDTTKDNFAEIPSHVELLRQITTGALLFASGGRATKTPTGLILPVSSGYKVTVDLAGNDTWTVRRIMTRGIKTWLKGEVADVYPENLAEMVCQASSYKSYEFPKPEGE